MNTQLALRTQHTSRVSIWPRNEHNHFLSTPRSCSHPKPANRSLGCRSEQSRSRQSAKERLRANPAYQRLKKTSWNDSYTPADGSKGPGPVPKHLLGEEEDDTATQRLPRGSITDQLQSQQERGQTSMQQPQATHSQEASIASRPTTSQEASELSEQSQSQLAEVPGRQYGLSQANRHVRTTRVRFWLQFHAQFGQRMRVVGSHENLGSWILSKGAELQWSPNDMWNAIVELPAGVIVEYKYVLLENDGSQAIAWQQGNNSVLAVGHDDDDVEVHDNWEAAPGAAVVVGGATSTREGRLLSWASEIEALFASQRSELRKSRMELVAAQEEARLAREEARRFQMELRASEAERIKAEMKVKEYTNANRLLKTQLADTTLTFRNALETTHQFLLQAEEMLSQRVPEGASPDTLSKGTPETAPSSTSSGAKVEADSSDRSQLSDVSSNGSGPPPEGLPEASTPVDSSRDQSETGSPRESSPSVSKQSAGSVVKPAAGKRKGRSRKSPVKAAAASATAPKKRSRRGKKAASPIAPPAVIESEKPDLSQGAVKKEVESATELLNESTLQQTGPGTVTAAQTNCHSVESKTMTEGSKPWAQGAAGGATLEGRALVNTAAMPY